jgi:hypothetical protein
MKFVERPGILAELCDRIADAMPRDDANRQWLTRDEIVSIVESTCASHPYAASRFAHKPTRQLTLTLEQWNSKKCPECGADLEKIEGHWLLRDCALCGWCRRWFGRPADELDTGTSTRFTTIEVKANSDREPEKGS